MPAIPAFTYDVFISHATRDDAALIDRIAQRLTEAGLRVYVDHQRLQPGDTWDGDIQVALQQSQVGLLALSPHALASAECNGEWRYLLNQQRRLYPVRIAPVAAADFHSRLCIIQYADVVDDFDAGMAALVAALCSPHGHLDAASPAVRVTQPGSGSFPHHQLDLPIFGRDAVLTQASAELLRQHPVVLTGIGGVGKTKLAAVLAATGAFIDGTLWYRIPAAATPEKARLDLDNLTALLREHLQLPPSTPEAAAWEALGRQHLLLVLDNAEDCLLPAPYAERLLALHQAHAAVLITSRHRWPELHNRAHEYHLPVPEPAAAEAILTAMIERGGEVPPLTPAETRDLAAAAHYHPRLMEFASGWLKDYDAAWVIGRLRELRGKNIEEALREVVGQTLDLVRQTEGGPQALADLTKLVVYAGGFDIKAAEALLPATAEASVSLLRSWYLLRFDRPRYTVDPLVTAVVVPDEAAYAVHYKHYKALAQQHNEWQHYMSLVPEIGNLEAAFEWAMRTGEVEQAYWLANAAREVLHIRGRFAQQLQWLKLVLDALPSDATEALRASLWNSLGISYNAQPLGNRLANLRQAIAAFQTTLRHYTEQTAPLEFATIQNNLGAAYADLSQVEDREANLRYAIAAYQAALRHRSEQTAPLSFAMTQNNLGNAYTYLAQLEDREANLRYAIAAYQVALRHRNEQTSPLNFAMTQNNLGIAYAYLAQVENHEANLRRTIAAFQAALRHYTEQTAPLAFATTQSNLGNAYRNLAPVEDCAANLHRAIAAHQAALRHRTEQAAPLAFATTQNNLGNVYWNLAEVEDREVNLRHAIAAFQAALRHRTEQAAPLDFAMTQNNLGGALELAGDLPAAIQCRQHAERAYRYFGDLANANQMQAWITEAQETLRHQHPTA